MGPWNFSNKNTQQIVILIHRPYCHYTKSLHHPDKNNGFTSTVSRLFKLSDTEKPTFMIMIMLSVIVDTVSFSTSAPHANHS